MGEMIMEFTAPASITLKSGTMPSSLSSPLLSAAFAFAFGISALCRLPGSSSHARADDGRLDLRIVIGATSCHDKGSKRDCDCGAASSCSFVTSQRLRTATWTAQDPQNTPPWTPNLNHGPLGLSVHEISNYPTEDEVAHRTLTMAVSALFCFRPLWEDETCLTPVRIQIANAASQVTLTVPPCRRPAWPLSSSPR